MTGPLYRDKIAFTQSLEYRFVRTPVESLPPLQRDTKLESFDSFTQFDLNISSKQTATISSAVFPQNLDYLGLNTFVPQASTPDLHSRGYQASLQHRYVSDSGGVLISQFSYKRFDADVFPNSPDPYRLLLETTEGGFFNRRWNSVTFPTESTHLKIMSVDGDWNSGANVAGEIMSRTS